MKLICLLVMTIFLSSLCCGCVCDNISKQCIIEDKYIEETEETYYVMVGKMMCPSTVTVDKFYVDTDVGTYEVSKRDVYNGIIVGETYSVTINMFGDIVYYRQ